MATNPSKRVLYGLQRLHCRGTPANPAPRSSISSSISNPRLTASPPSAGNPPIRGSFSSEVFPHGLSNSPSNISSSIPEFWGRPCSLDSFLKPTSPSGLLSRFLSPKYNPCAPYVKNLVRNCSCGVTSSGFSNSRCFSTGIPSKLRSLSPRTPGLGGIRGNGLRSRFFSSKNLSSGKFSLSLGKSAATKPLAAVASVASRYREAVGLQTEAFWKRNYLVLVGAATVVLCIVLWRIMFGVASTFVGLSEGMAKYGFLALASAIVAFSVLYIRSRFTINPDKIYRIAMRKLNTSAGILEIMGAPLTGTDVRAYVMSGGGPRLKNFKLRFGAKRCFLIFPIRGAERKGLVSVEAKKKKGQYDMKLLAVDIPMATGPDQRLFLIGDEQEYKVGGGLISELRDPIVKAMAAEKEFEDLDQKEEEEDEERELAEEERKRREEVEKLEKESP